MEDQLAALLKRQPMAFLVLEIIALVAGIGWIDWATGYEVTFFPFYSVPILLALWFAGKRAGVAVSILSALAWWCADTASGHLYAQEWLRFWDAIVRLIFFCLVVIAGSAFRDQRDANRAKIALLERSRKLEREIVTISEREQRRIGRDLHDSLGQRLVALSFAADSLRGELPPESGRAAKAVEDMASLLRDAVRTARDLARGLSPVSGEADGLISALETLADTNSRFTGIQSSFVFSGDGRLDDETKAVHLYRIAQEAVNNAAKHSSATHIIIALDLDHDALELRIGDDGSGFSPEGDSSRQGMGLDIMRYRAGVIGGTLEISANSPRGTVVACRIHESTAREVSANHHE